MPCFSRIISEALPEIYITEACDFLKSIIHSQIIKFSVKSCYEKPALRCMNTAHGLAHVFKEVNFMRLVNSFLWQRMVS